LPGTLTLESLRHDHASVPNNPLIAESLYLTRYIERVGSGTQAMIALCREAGLPEPDFELRDGFFVVTLWRDWLTDQVVGELNLNDRQMKAIAVIRQQRRLSNSDYQSVAGATRPTAKRDLEDLVRKGVLVPQGRGRGAHYELLKKRLVNGSKGSPGSTENNGS
jgi:predicted HTH transcriptional regulator